MNIEIAKMPSKTAAEEVYANLDNLPDGFTDVRQQAANYVAKSGLPHRRIEEWKWTDLRRLVDQAYPAAIGGNLATAELDSLLAVSPFGALADSRLVFVNGVFDESRSQLPQAVSVSTLAKTENADFELRDGDVIDALNLAYASDGAIITVAKGQKVEKPVELVFVTAPDQPATVTTRNVITLEEGAELTILETHVGHSDAYVANTVSEISIADNATLHRVRLQEDGEKSTVLSNIVVTLGADALVL